MGHRSRTRSFDLWQLECFCAVARAGSFTKGAEDLGIAQPSLSEQIARLEQNLGAPLFERLSRRTELTPLGEAIVGRAQALLEDAASLPDHFERLREGARRAAGGGDPDDPAVLPAAAAEEFCGAVRGRRLACSRGHDGGAWWRRFSTG